MTASRETEIEIRRLFFAEHWKKGTIAKQLCIHGDVVERVIGPLGPEPKCGRRPKTLDPYQGVIDDTLGRYPTVVATRIYDMICERGYTGSIETLRRLVSKRRPRKPSEVFTRSETLPGEQSQIDWAHVGQLRVPGGQRPLYCFVLLLRHSRAIWAELVLEQTTASLVRSLVRAARHFDGVTHEWLFDNPRSIVAAREGSALRFQEDLVDLAGQLHVALRACRVRRPTDKGGVERAIRYLKTRFFPARSISSIEAGNTALWNFLDTVALERAHPVMRDMSVREILELEKTRLLPLPDAEIHTDLILSATADKTAFVAFDCNRYSVPSDSADRTLRVVANDVEVRICAEHDRVVATHQRCWSKGKRIVAPEHREDVLDKKPAAREGTGRERLRAEVPRAGDLMQHWLDDARNVGFLVARTLKLLDLYGKTVLGQAVDELMERGSHDYGALALLCEKHRKRPRRILPIELGAHVVERDVIPHDLGGYDDEPE